MNELLILFIICNIANVIIQTIKSIATIKGSPLVAALVNAIAYGFYTYIIIITNCNLPIWQKMIIVALANLVGVFVVKLVEEKSKKDKIWKVEVTVQKKDFNDLIMKCKKLDLSYNYIDIEKYYLFNFYCDTQKDTTILKELLTAYKVKYFVSETKIL